MRIADYNPENLDICFGETKIIGFHAEKITKEPWYKIFNYPKNHPDYIEGSTRISCRTEDGGVVLFYLLNGSESLSKIKNSDPFDGTIVALKVKNENS